MIIIWNEYFMVNNIIVIWNEIFMVNNIIVIWNEYFMVNNIIVIWNEIFFNGIFNEKYYEMNIGYYDNNME